MKKNFFLLIFLVFSIRLLLSLFIPIVGDEAYYWYWSKHLQLSYFDHPGMVAWISYLSHFIPFFPDHIKLRLLFLFISTLTFAVWLMIYRLQFPNTTSKGLTYFTLFYLLNPLSGIGGVFVTPDLPLSLFWSLSLLSILKILKHHKAIDYILLGIFLGLGFCSKYHIIFLPVFTLISLLLTKKVSQINIKYLFMTIFFGILFCLPVIIWNYTNDFASFKFQLNHGFKGKTNFEFWWSITYFIGQLLIFNPFLFLDFIKDFKNKLTTQVSLLQWCFFLYSSLKAKVEANWPVMSHYTALTSINFETSKYFKKALLYSLLIYALLIVYLFTPQFEKKLNLQPTQIMAEAIIPEVIDYQPLYGPTYQMSSLLTMFSGKEIYKLRNLSRHDFFDSLNQSMPIEKKYYALKYFDTQWPEHTQGMLIKSIKKFEKYELELFELTYE